MTTSSQSAATREDLYVGYRPLPPRDRKFIGVAVPIALGFLFGFGGVWAATQSDPGAGVWQTTSADGTPPVFRGVIVARPYPVLYTERSLDGKPGAMVLVESGKHGASGRAATVDGEYVEIRGWPLHRDGQVMIEIDPANSAIQRVAAPTVTPLPTRTSLGTATLRGEIVDAKCYLGAMKPGQGKTHKDCATLCIRGGIPPLFIARDAAGQQIACYLANRDGGALDESFYPFIADPVQVTGELEECGGIRILRVRPEDVIRL